MKKFLNKLPMILVIIMVVIVLMPAVRTVVTNITSGSAGNTADGTQEAQSPAASADGEYFLTWEKYVNHHGFTQWNWNDAADAIEKVALHAADLYEAGDKDQAYQFAKATYWGYYETTGFERNTMTYISGARVSETELQFTTLRKAVKKDLGADVVRAEAEKLSALLHEDALILSPEGAIAGVGKPAADEQYFLTWAEYAEYYGFPATDWHDAADAIEKVALHAADLYEAGDKDQAYQFAKATYWGYYETTGFERNTMTYISGARVSETELQFTTLRKAVKKDLGADVVRAEAEKLSALLHEDAYILDPDGPSNNQTNTGSDTNTDASSTSSESSAGGAVATFAGSFGIILSEGVEAILVVGAIIAYLIKSGNKNGVAVVYIGSALGVACSFAMAALLSWLKSINPETTMSQEIIEGFAALLAVVVLFYVSNWMASKSEAAAWQSYINSKVVSSQDKAKSASGSMFTLAFTAWLAVFREGAEVILFYQPMLNEGHSDMVWLGFGTGCLALVVIFVLMRVFSVKLPVKPFFLGMSFLMAFMTVCFFGAGIKELMEGGVFDDFGFMLESPSWLSWIPYNDVLDVFGIYPLTGTIIPQLILLAIMVVTFIVQIRRNNKIKAEAANQG